VSKRTCPPFIAYCNASKRSSADSIYSWTKRFLNMRSSIQPWTDSIHPNFSALWRLSSWVPVLSRLTLKRTGKSLSPKVSCNLENLEINASSISACSSLFSREETQERSGTIPSSLDNVRKRCRDSLSVNLWSWLKTNKSFLPGFTKSFPPISHGHK